jgi:hypothetical protein
MEKETNNNLNIDLTTLAVLLVDNNSLLHVMYENMIKDISGQDKGDKFMKVFEDFEEQRDKYKQAAISSYFQQSRGSDTDGSSKA